MLVARNDKHETPLDRAFDMRKWKIVRILLKECIERSFLPELTGISPDAMKSETLLHRAFQCGKVKYLRIFLEVCRECNVEPQQIQSALVMQTECGCTPWYYLMNHTCLKTMRKTLEILKLFDIDINSLYIDSETQKSSLLHEAVRRDHKAFIDLLLRSGANRNLEDARGLKPFDRKRKVDSESLTDGDSSLPAAHEHRQNQEHPWHFMQQHIVVEALSTLETGQAVEQPAAPVESISFPRETTAEEHAPSTLETGQAVEQPAAPVESLSFPRETTAEEHVLPHPSSLISPDSVSMPATAGQHTLFSSATEQRPPEETTLPQATCIVNGTAVIYPLDLLTVGNAINHVQFDAPCDHAPIGHPEHHYIALLANCGPPGVT